MLQMWQRTRIIKLQKHIVHMAKNTPVDNDDEATYDGDDSDLIYDAERNDNGNNEWGDLLRWC